MADAKTDTGATVDKAKGGVAVLPLIVAVVAAVTVAVALVGGAGFWLVSSGKLTLGAGVPKVEAAVKQKPKTKFVTLDPLLVNLADDGGHSFLRVAMTLKVEDPPPAKGEKAKEEAAPKGKPVNEFEAAERDAALTVIGRSNAVALLAPEGKEKLKAALKTSLETQVPEARVVEVLFTEFLVQQ